MDSIPDDLRGHAWYNDLVVRMLSDVEAYLAHWAAFDEYLGEPSAGATAPRRRPDPAA
ncbi:MAG: hypothetical protein ABR569_08915 [Gaiellaceae bacterium]